MRHIIYKTTSDDWHPSYTLEQWCDGVKNHKLVQVTLTQTGSNPPENGLWCVVVRGGDDYGLSKCFPSLCDAMDCFMRVAYMQDVTIASLQEMEFAVC